MTIDRIKDISILVVEDESELREYIVEYLEIFFSRVYSAEDGEKALSIYDQKHPNIILTDINIPNLDGLSLVSKIREKDKETKIIIMSAHSEQEKLLEAIKLHLEMYLIKPIKTDMLKKTLMDCVELIRKTQRQIRLSENISWNKNSDTLMFDNKEIKLVKKECEIIKLLLSRPNYIFSSQEIFKHLWQNKGNKEFSNSAITSLMKRLRIKLPEDIIINVYGAGYKIAQF